MKRILLTSTALVAFAGAAAAEVGFSGSFTLGYNDESSTGDYGFYWDAGLSVSGSMELDNGLTAGFSADIILDDGHGHAFLSSSVLRIEAYEFYLTSDTAGLYFGDTASAADTYWDDVSGSAVTGFYEDANLRGEVTYGSISAALSYVLDGSLGSGAGLEAMQLAVKADVGSATVYFAYEDDYMSGSEIIGLGASTTFGGADVMGTYLTDGTETSIGVSVDYSIGAATTVGFYYTSNDVADDAWGVSVGYASGPVSVNAEYDSTDDWLLEGSYDVGNGVMVYAGVADAGEDMYLAATYDLGGGAELLFSYAVDDDADSGDEVGDPEYQVGATLEVSFEF